VVRCVGIAGRILNSNSISLPAVSHVGTEVLPAAPDEESGQVVAVVTAPALIGTV
jgi:hypothetical protein